MRYALGLVLALGFSSLARADFVEPSTGHAFAESKGGMTLVGAGVRKKFVVKVYAMALYVDAGEGKKAFPSLVQKAGGADHDKLAGSEFSTAFVASGGFSKMGVLHFVRDVEAEKIKGAFRDGLEDELADKAGPDMKKGAEAFIAAFDQNLKSGQEIQIRTTGDKIAIEVAGQKREVAGSPKLSRAVWNIWLGAHPISGDLKKALVDRIDQLGK